MHYTCDAYRMYSGDKAAAAAAAFAAAAAYYAFAAFAAAAAAAAFAAAAAAAASSMQRRFVQGISNLVQSTTMVQVDSHGSKEFCDVIELCVVSRHVALVHHARVNTIHTGKCFTCNPHLTAASKSCFKCAGAAAPRAQTCRCLRRVIPIMVRWLQACSTQLNRPLWKLQQSNHGGCLFAVTEFNGVAACSR